MRGAFRNTFAAPSRAAREDRALRHLAECGIQPELALGYAERRWLGWLREARLLTRGFGDEDLAQRIERRRAESEARPGLRADELPGLGAFLGAIFDSGLVDPDLRVRNLLCAGTGEATRWAKIDASSSRIRRRPLGPAERARDLAPLLEELRAAGCDETALAELSSAARASPARR
jgi:tRNA A-37 threonylcarbamoyl transferase component Bud32